MTSHYDTSSFRDDMDLDPNVHPALAHAVHQLKTWHAQDVANQRMTTPHRWPFPAQPIPIDRRKLAPTAPDAEAAPW